MGKADARFNISAKDKTRAAFAGVNKRLKGLRSTVTGTGARIAALVGVGGFGAIVTSSANAADALAKKADQLDINIQKLAGLQHATKLYTDVGAPAMNEALVKSSKRLGEYNATGGGAAATWLKTLNLDTQNLAQLKPDELFNEYSKAIGGLNNRGAQLAAISALMGDESRALHPLIMAGTDAIKESTDEAIAFGTALTRVDAAQIEEAGDQMTKVGVVVSGVGTRIAVKLAPFITALSDKFIVAAKESDGFSGAINWGMEKASLAVGFFGDTWHVLQVIFKTVQVAVNGVIVGIITSLDELNKAGAVALNWIPGIDITPSPALTEWAEKGRDVVIKLSDELVALAKEPMPSEGIEVWFKTFQEKARVAGEKVAANLAGGSGDEGDPGAITVDPRLQQKLDKLNQSLLGEEERLAQSYASRAEIVGNAFQAGMISEEQQRLRLQQLEGQHQAAMLRIHSGGAIRMATFDKANWKNKATATAQWMKGMTSTAATHNRAAFELNKIAAVSEGVLALRETVMGAYKVGAKIGGPITGGIFAGIAGGVQALNIAAIAGTQFGGGGGGGGGSGGGGAVPTYDANPVTGFPAGNTATSAQKIDISVTVGGDISPEVADQLALAIAKNVADGGTSPLPV